MNNANAQSSIKVTSSKKEVEKICCNFGKFTTDGKMVKMEPEYAKSLKEQDNEFVEGKAKDHISNLDSKGNVAKRIDSNGREIKLTKLDRKIEFDGKEFKVIVTPVRNNNREERTRA